MSGIVTAGIDVQADGFVVRLSVSVPRPASSAPSSAAGTSADAAGGAEALEPEVGLAVRLATEAAPQLLEAFEQLQIAVLASQVTLLEEQLQQQRGKSSGSSA